MKSLEDPEGSPPAARKKIASRPIVEEGSASAVTPCPGGLQGLQVFAGFVIPCPFCILLIPSPIWEFRFLVREAALETLQIPSNPH
jgi:hypothetical protein